MRGHKPEWDNLPRRKCDDCGKTYKPKQPLKKDQRGFCSDNCRKSYHKHGGAYRKLKGEVQKMVTREMEKINAGLSEALERNRADLLELIRAVNEQRTAQDVAPAASPLRRVQAAFRQST